MRGRCLNSFHCKYGFLDMENILSHSFPTNDLLLRITSDPDTLHGKPRIKGTRIPVYLVVNLIAAGESIPHILEDYPSLTKEDISAALRYVNIHLGTQPFPLTFYNFRITRVKSPARSFHSLFFFCIYGSFRRLRSHS